jgi:hypothetical protein
MCGLSQLIERGKTFIKGTVSGTEKYFLMVLKMKSDGFHIIWLPFVQKLKIKLLIASMKLLANFENPPSHPLQDTCCGSQVAACVSEICLESQL